MIIVFYSIFPRSSAVCVYGDVIARKDFSTKSRRPGARPFGKTENGKGVKCLLNPSLIISTNFVGRRQRLKTCGFLPFNFISVFFFRFLPPTYVYTPLGRRTENFPQNLVAPPLRVGFAGASKSLDKRATYKGFKLLLSTLAAVFFRAHEAV